MKNESPSPPFEPMSADERWIDAALSEHARLGPGGTDEEMILRILAETVHRPGSSGSFPQGARRHPRNPSRLHPAAVPLAAAAAFAILLAGLASLQTTRNSRHSEELRFVVQLASPRLEVPPPPQARPNVAALPRPVALPSVDFHAATSPDSTTFPDPGEVVTEFGPTFTQWPREVLRDERLRIVADERDSTARGQAFHGDVVVEHDRFRIEAEEVEVAAAGASSTAGDPALLARRVRVVQPGVGCRAEAELLRYDPLTEALILTGVSRVETDRGELARFNPGDRLVISPSGFSVETAPKEFHASPLPLKR